MDACFCKRVVREAFLCLWYYLFFSKVLLTGREFLDGVSKASFKATMSTLLGMRMIPILNNNDVVTPTEAERKVCADREMHL